MNDFWLIACAVMVGETFVLLGLMVLIAIVKLLKG